MIILEKSDLDEIRARINNVWDYGYQDKQVTLIESIAALVSIEAILNVLEERYRNKEVEANGNSSTSSW